MLLGNHGEAPSLGSVINLCAEQYLVCALYCSADFRVLDLRRGPRVRSLGIVNKRRVYIEQGRKKEWDKEL